MPGVSQEGKFGKKFYTLMPTCQVMVQEGLGLRQFSVIDYGTESRLDC